MRTDFSFQNVCGAVYKQGNVVFTKCGKQLISPVGNRVAVFDLARSTSRAAPFECMNDIQVIDLSADETLMVCVDAAGFVYFVNWPARVQIETFFMGTGHTTRTVKISPCGRYVAIAKGRQIEILNTPPTRTRQHRTVNRIRRLTHTFGDVSCIKWSPCCRYVLFGGEDCTVRIVSLCKQRDRRWRKNNVVTLSGHRTPIVDVHFATADCTRFYSVSTDRAVRLWEITDERRNDTQAISRMHRMGGAGEVEPAGDEVADSDDLEEEDEEDEEDEEGEEGEEDGEGAEEEDEAATSPVKIPELEAFQWIVKRAFYFPGGSKVSVAEYCAKKDMFFTGFKDGSFGVFLVEGFGRDAQLKCVHTLSITEQRIDSAALSPNAEWVAFASGRLGQLLVWEWRSETYVLKQQAHYHDVNTIAYSPDGALIASAGDDGKVKVWSGSAGFCFTTFREHQGPVSEVRFANATTLWSSSSDGTVRGYDLKRYRCFRALTPPRTQQLSCLAIDPSGELVAAGGLGQNDVLLWSTQTGQLLDAFSGHDAPIGSIDFHPSGAHFASVSWDKKVLVWEVFARHGAGVKGRDATAKLRSGEALMLNSEGLAVRFSPDGSKLAVLTLNANVNVFSTEDLSDIRPITSINVGRDVKGGWRASEATTPYGRNHGRFFNSIDWAPDGTCFLLGGNSMWVALYSADQGHLLRKWPVSHNRSLDGMRDVYDWRMQSEAGDLRALDVDEPDEEDRRRRLIKLPGAHKGDQGKRSKTAATARSNCVRFCPTSREWAAATTDGLLVFSLDGDVSKSFNPVVLTAGLTPVSIYSDVEKSNFAAAMLGALNLGDKDLLSRIFYAVPSAEVDFVAAQIPNDLLSHALEAVAAELDTRRHVELCLRWAAVLMSRHAGTLARTAHADAVDTATGTRRVDGRLSAALKLLHKSVTRRSGELSTLAAQNCNRLSYILAAPPPPAADGPEAADSAAREAPAEPTQLGFGGRSPVKRARSPPAAEEEDEGSAEMDGSAQQQQQQPRRRRRLAKRCQNGVAEPAATPAAASPTRRRKLRRRPAPSTSQAASEASQGEGSAPAAPRKRRRLRKGPAGTD